MLHELGHAHTHLRRVTVDVVVCVVRVHEHELDQLEDLRKLLTSPKGQRCLFLLVLF